MQENAEKTMEKYIRVIVHKKSGFHVAIAKNIVCDTNGRFVYGEFIGNDSKESKDLRSIINEIKDKYGLCVVMDGGSYINRKPEGKYISSVENIGRGMAYGYLCHEDSIRGKNANIFLGRSKEEITIQFKKWLTESQPLPYPHGYKEDIKMEAEEYLFNILVERGFIKTLTEVENEIYAYQIDSSLKDANIDMQRAILKVVKDANLLEIDRIRKILKEAPAIGESDLDAAKVFTVIQNLSTNKIYHVIECDSGTDNIFCLIDNNGAIEWEEHNLEKLFNNEQNIVLKGEDYENLYLDTNGNKIKKQHKE